MTTSHSARKYAPFERSAMHSDAVFVLYEHTGLGTMQDPCIRCKFTNSDKYCRNHLCEGGIFVSVIDAATAALEHS